MGVPSPPHPLSPRCLKPTSDSLQLYWRGHTPSLLKGPRTQPPGDPVHGREQGLKKQSRESPDPQARGKGEGVPQGEQWVPTHTLASRPLASGGHDNNRQYQYWEQQMQRDMQV